MKCFIRKLYRYIYVGSSSSILGHPDPYPVKMGPDPLHCTGGENIKICHKYFNTNSKCLRTSEYK